MTLKQVEQTLWNKTKEQLHITYDSGTEKSTWNTLEDLTSYYTMSDINTTINTILNEYEEHRKKDARIFIEDNIDLLDYDIDDFLEKCPGTIIDNVINILKEADIITEDHLKKLIQNTALDQLRHLYYKGFKCDIANNPSTTNIVIDTISNYTNSYIEEYINCKGKEYNA